AHLADGLPNVTPMPGRGPALAIEAKDSTQIGISLQQLRRTRFDPPEDFRPGKMLFEQPKDRQRLHDVTQRTRFQNENLQGAPRSFAKPRALPKEFSTQDAAR